MAAYTFYPCKADGVSVSFVACDLKSDVEAQARAAAILEEHASSAFVEAWQGERMVFALHRPRSAPASGPTAAGPAL